MSGAPTGNMKAVWYNKAHDFEIKQVPIPEITDEEILLKVRIGGLCGTDVSLSTYFGTARIV